MRIKEKSFLVVASALLTLSLTACDPPMPLSLQIAQAELQVQCEEGEVQLAIPEALTELGYSWAESALIACENMFITSTLDDKENLEIQLSELSTISQGCNPFAKVPVAIDAAVFVTNIPDYYEVYLSPEQLIQIFDGTVTNWSDPALLENNEEFPLPDLEIILPASATVSSKNAISDWFERIVGKPFDLSTISDAAEVSELELAFPEEAGAIGIASVSAATYTGSSIVALALESGNPESLIRPDYESILSAKTQLVSSVEGTEINLRLDPSIEPQAEEGLTEAVAPYQAIYPIEMALCGDDTTLKRTVARYLLRQDSQGILAASALMPVPEAIRIQAIEIVAVGLPTPSPSPTNE